MWTEKGKQPIRPKGKGWDIMVSDFIEEHGGYLQLSDKEYKSAKNSPLTQVCGKREGSCSSLGLHEYEGYWDREKFLNQVEHSIKIAEIKYLKESHSLVFFVRPKQWPYCLL